MGSIRFTFLSVAVLSLTTTLLAADNSLSADEQPDALKPLQVLEDCLEAAEAGDFERYVDHLSADELTLQAGYILLMTRTMSHSIERGSNTTDPEASLVARTMRDLLSRHTVPQADRKAEHHAAEQTLGRLTGEVPTPFPTEVGNRRDQIMQSAEVCKDKRRFLVEAFAELARPTEVSGEKVPRTNSPFNIAAIIERAKKLKWTLYTRGAYAIATAAQPEAQAHPYQPRPAPQPTQVEFERIDGQWKVTRLLPAAVVFPSNRFARVGTR